MSETKKKLQEVLEGFSNKLTYHDLDTRALDISRASAAGNLGEGNYADWAMVSNDPLVIVNIVKTYITTLTSKLTANPFRPADDKLADLMEKIRLNARLSDQYHDVLNDGYSYLAVGRQDGNPVTTQVDARYILFNGDDPTLKDATEIVIFKICPKTDKDKEDDKFSQAHFPDGFVSYDTDEEKVITTYYHFEGEGAERRCVMDVYNNYDDEPDRTELGQIDRIPVIRFVGDKVELEDKRFHYRGLYYQTASVLKAMTLSATKIQIRTAAADDDNYIASSDALNNYPEQWENCGVKTIDHKDSNGQPIPDPIIPIAHDNEFLINAFNNWKGVIADMLGPVVASGSEAVTREEVIARNEVRDAITNEYLSKFVDSVEEVYRCIIMLMGGPADKVQILGGFIESVKRQKTTAEIIQLYGLAKESGLNTQGFVQMILENSEIPTDKKMFLAQTLMKDPFASPVVQQLKAQIQQLTEQTKAKDQTIALLRGTATLRLERDAGYVAEQEREHQRKILFDQWKEEQQQTQDARMLVLKTLLEQGDTAGAMACLAAISEKDQPLVVPDAPNSQLQQAQNAVQGQIDDAFSPIQQTQRALAAQAAQRKQQQMTQAQQVQQPQMPGAQQ